LLPGLQILPGHALSVIEAQVQQIVFLLEPEERQLGVLKLLAKGDCLLP